MATHSSHGSSRHRGRLLRKLGLAGGVLVALLLLAYFVVTSSAFVKGVILPKVGAAMNSEVTAGGVSVSPFSQVQLQDFKVQPKGTEPLFTAKEIRLRYSLMSILGGTIAVQELFVDSPAVTLVQNADGSSNLDPITQASAAPPPAASGATKPLVLDIQSVVVENASLKQTTKFSAGGEQMLDVGAGSLSLTHFKNGQPAQLELGANVGFRTSQPTNATLSARLDGKLTLAVGNDGLPKTVSGGVKLLVNQATGMLADLAQSAAVLDCNMTPTDITQVALKLQRAGTNLAQVRVSGPFDTTKREGKLTLEAFGIDRNVLNLAGRSLGWDFGQTTFNSTNFLALSDGGRSFELSGKFLGRKFSLAQGGEATPALDLEASYDLTVDRTKETATLRDLRLLALQGTNQFVQGALSRPMKLVWARNSAAVDESEFKVTLAGLNLREYRPILGTNLQAGVLNGGLEIQSKAAGKQVYFIVTGNGANLAVAAGTNVFSALGFSLKSSSTLLDFEKLQLKEGDFRLTHRNQEALHAAITGVVDLAKQDTTLMLLADAPLPVLAGISPMPGTTFAGGVLSFSGALKRENVTLPGTTGQSFAQKLDGNLTVTDLNCSYDVYRLEAWGAKLSFDLGVKDTQATLNKLNGTLLTGGQPAGTFSMEANSHLATKVSKLTLNFTDLNQRALGPFIHPFLVGRTLDRLALNGKLSFTYDPKTNHTPDGALTGTAKLSNLALHGANPPAQPLEAALDFSLDLLQSTAAIRTCSLKLTPSPRGSDEITATGSVDFSKLEAVTGAFKLVADKLDFTPYYDHFMAATSVVATAGTQIAAESEVMILPVRNLVSEATINHLYLRDLDAANVQTTVILDGGRTLVKPFQATLNGAPVKGTLDLDLGVPGSTYDLNLSAQDVPIPPLVSLAMPERAGQFSGTATATMQIKGAGTSGTNFARNLSGNYYLGTTNLNFKLTDAQSSILKTVVNVVIGIPDLIRGVPALLKDPSAGLSSLMGKLTGASTNSAPGWLDQIKQTPVDVILLRGEVGGGRVQVQEAVLRSPAFLVETKGDIMLAPELTNSPVKLPLQISLARGLAEKVKLVPAGTPTNALYARLPDFAAVKGTIGNPKADLNALALTSLAAQAGAGALGNAGGAVGNALSAVSSLLGGSATTNRASTNAPAGTNTSSGGLGKALGNFLSGALKAMTNAPAGQTNPPAASTNAPPAKPASVTPPPAPM